MPSDRGTSLKGKRCWRVGRRSWRRQQAGTGFSSIDALEEMDIGDGMVPRPTYVNANLMKE
jgi:hypothetical protein